MKHIVTIFLSEVFCQAFSVDIALRKQWWQCGFYFYNKHTNWIMETHFHTFCTMWYWNYLRQFSKNVCLQCYSKTLCFVGYKADVTYEGEARITSYQQPAASSYKPVQVPVPIISKQLIIKARMFFIWKKLFKNKHLFYSVALTIIGWISSRLWHPELTPQSRQNLRKLQLLSTARLQLSSVTQLQTHTSPHHRQLRPQALSPLPLHLLWTAPMLNPER